MKLIPAPLSTSRDECKAQFSVLLPHFSHFQIDIQDGIYVPNKTLGLSDYLEVIHDEISLRQLANPNDTQITLDVHLMLQDYEVQLQDIQQMDPQLHEDHITLRCVFVHTNITHKQLDQYKDLSLAMTFSPPDNPQDWTDYLQASKHAQVMTIYPGPQGQSFMPEMLVKIGQIHGINPHIQVCIDGAVNEMTFPIIKSSSSPCIPDELAVGSYFSKANPEDIVGRIRNLSD